MIEEPAEALLQRAAAAAAAGELIVLPTDTVYGIGTRPDDPAATGRLFDAKGRPADLPLPVLVPSLSSAVEIASFDERAHRLARRAWPGAITLVLPRARRAAAWDLGGDAATIGVRQPRHPTATGLLERTGPLAVTSANRSGESTPITCDAVRAVFADAVAVYLCDEVEVESRPSTVVDLTGSCEVVLREGQLGASELRELLADPPPRDRGRRRGR
jgi:L-threonylcarbamoyladenylate synthase